jgi:hypothetical protein
LEVTIVVEDGKMPTSGFSPHDQRIEANVTPFPAGEAQLAA